jgi:hypothetical protein
MAIVLITEALLERSSLADGTILHDRMPSGFCARKNPRRRTFRVATSVAGRRAQLGLDDSWPRIARLGSAHKAAMGACDSRSALEPVDQIDRISHPRAIAWTGVAINS